MKYSNLSLVVIVVSLVYLQSCSRLKYPETIRFQLLDTITGEPIPNCHFKYVQTKNPLLASKQDYNRGKSEYERSPKLFEGEGQTDAKGFCEFDIEKNGMDYVTLNFNDQNMANKIGYYPKSIELEQLKARYTKNVIYQVKLFPVRYNLAYKVVVRYRNGVNNGPFLYSDTMIVRNYQIEDLNLETSSQYNYNKEFFKLNIMRGKSLADSTDILYAPNANHKFTRKVYFYYHGNSASRYYGNCSDDVKEFELLPNKINRIDLNFP
jgi:hypothetical protein